MEGEAPSEPFLKSAPSGSDGASPSTEGLPDDIDIITAGGDALPHFFEYFAALLLVARGGVLGIVAGLLLGVAAFAGMGFGGLGDLKFIDADAGSFQSLFEL